MGIGDWAQSAIPIKIIYIFIIFKKEITLLSEYGNSCYGISDELWNEVVKKIELYPEFIEVYVNDKKIPFSFDYKINNEKEIKVKFKIKCETQLIYAYMFGDCYSLKSIDLSSFDTSNVTTMDGMFYGCSF